ncbi:hypothetical protein EVAR_33843_1 [Eumeta japonica]|uniref:Uncharacterized protein n=1 Tax=Eumeta variegata TaxID=151549 RepID=A0A4C1VAT4_EUMVA|nr:hypothetical protein EVAR_33843_1 [Eumeta japonica]
MASVGTSEKSSKPPYYEGRMLKINLYVRLFENVTRVVVFEVDVARRRRLREALRLRLRVFCFHVLRRVFGVVLLPEVACEGYTNLELRVATTSASLGCLWVKLEDRRTWDFRPSTLARCRSRAVSATDGLTYARKKQGEGD